MEAPALTIYQANETTVVELPVRGVAWVLGWTAVVVSLAASAMILVTFAYQLAVEQSLHRAAEAGLREASLPRASSRSVEFIIRQHLAERFSLDLAATVSLERSGVPMSGILRLRPGEQLSITLSVRADAVMPRWLTALPGLNSVRITQRVKLQSGDETGSLPLRRGRHR